MAQCPLPSGKSQLYPCRVICNLIVMLSFLERLITGPWYCFTRYLLNDACILAGKPLVSGSALRFEGQVRWRSFSWTKTSVWMDFDLLCQSQESDNKGCLHSSVNIHYKPPLLQKQLFNISMNWCKLLWICQTTCLQTSLT